MNAFTSKPFEDSVQEGKDNLKTLLAQAKTPEAITVYLTQEYEGLIVVDEHLTYRDQLGKILWFMSKMLHMVNAELTAVENSSELVFTPAFTAFITHTSHVLDQEMERCSPLKREHEACRATDLTTLERQQLLIWYMTLALLNLSQQVTILKQ